MTCPALVTASVQGSEEEIAKLGTPLNVNKGSTKKLCGALEQALKEGEQAMKKAKVARFGLLTPLQELNLDDGALVRAISAAVAFCEGQGATRVGERARSNPGSRTQHSASRARTREAPPRAAAR